MISESLDIKTASDYIETPPGHIETSPESILGEGAAPITTELPQQRDGFVPSAPLTLRLFTTIMLCSILSTQVPCDQISMIKYDQV